MLSMTATAQKAFDRALAANPVAVGEYLGRVAAEVIRMRRDQAGMIDASDVIDVAFGLVTVPLEIDDRNAPTQREREIVRILIGDAR